MTHHGLTSAESRSDLKNLESFPFSIH